MQIVTGYDYFYRFNKQFLNEEEINSILNGVQVPKYMSDSELYKLNKPTIDNIETLVDFFYDPNRKE